MAFWQSGKQFVPNYGLLLLLYAEFNRGTLEPSTDVAVNQNSLNNI